MVGGGRGEEELSQSTADIEKVDVDVEIATGNNNANTNKIEKTNEITDKEKTTMLEDGIDDKEGTEQRRSTKPLKSILKSPKEGRKR